MVYGAGYVSNIVPNIRPLLAILSRTFQAALGGPLMHPLCTPIEDMEQLYRSWWNQLDAGTWPDQPLPLISEGVAWEPLPSRAV